MRPNKQDPRTVEILQEIDNSHDAIKKHKEHITHLYDELVNRMIAPFKIGDEVMFIPDENFKIGNKYSKPVKVVIERGNACDINLRPYTKAKAGTLSAFSYPFYNYTYGPNIYSDFEFLHHYLKPLDEE